MKTSSSTKKFLFGYPALGICLLALPLRSQVACGSNSYECAAAAVAEHNLQDAASMLERLLLEEPHNLKASNLLGIVHLEEGKPELAKRDFRQIVAVAPRFYPALKNLAIAHFTLSEYALATKSFEEVQRLKPDDLVAALYLGELQYRSGDHVQASANFQKSGKMVLSIPAFAVHYADCLFLRSERPQAVAVIEQLDESASDAQFAAGVLLFGHKEFDLAATCFHRSQRAYSDPCAAGYNEAMSDLLGGSNKAVIDTTDRIIPSCPNKSELLNLKGAAYRKMNQVQPAYEALKKAAELSPYDEQNYIDLADLCLDYNNYDLGADIIDLGLKSIPDSQRLYLHKGVMEAMRGKMSAAEADFKFAADVAPNATLPKAALSLAWIAMGETRKAIDSLRQCERKNDSDFAISFLLGQALIRQGGASGAGEEGEAIAAFERAVKLNPQYAPARAELGKLLLRRGDESRGITEMEKALTLDPKDRTATYQLAQVYRRRGDEKRAAELNAQVRALNANDRDQDLKRAMISIVRQTARDESKTTGQDASTQLLHVAR